MSPVSTPRSLELRLDDESTLTIVLRLGALVGALAFVLFTSPRAQASAAHGPPPEPPPGASAVDVYRESIPTSTGPHVVGSERRRNVSLPPMIERRLRREGGRAASLLQEVATSPDLGAPIARRHAAVRRPPSVLPTGWAPTGLDGIAHDALGGRILVLLALLTAAAASGIGLTRRRA